MVFGFTPFGANPALLFQAMQCGIKRSLLHLQHVVRYLLNPLSDGPAMNRPEREGFQDQQVQRSLDQIGRPGQDGWLLLGNLQEAYHRT